MGEDVNFYDGAVADSRLVGALHALEEPPADPEKLALILDRWCGHDMMFKLYQLHPGYAARRRRTGIRLSHLQKYAKKLLSDDESGTEVYPFSVTIEDLLDDRTSFEERQSLTPRLISAIEVLAGLRLRMDFEKYHGPPQLDNRVTKIVHAIYEYWTEIEEKPFGGGLDRQPGSPVNVTKGSSASFTKGVIGVLGIACTDAQLETHMRNVRIASQS